MSNLVPFQGLQDVATRFAPAAAKASLGRGEEIATILIRGGEVAIGAMAASYMNSRLSAPGQDHVQVRGVPLDGVVGIAGIIGSVMGWFGPMSKDVAMLSLGFALPAIVRPITEIGMNHRLAREQLAAQVAAGELPASSQASSTPATTTETSKVPAWAQR